MTQAATTVSYQAVLEMMSNPEVCKAACRLGSPTDKDNITILLVEREGEYAVVIAVLVPSKKEITVTETPVGKGRVGRNRAITEFSRTVVARRAGTNMVQLSADDAKLRQAILAAIA